MVTFKDENDIPLVDLNRIDYDEKSSRPVSILKDRKTYNLIKNSDKRATNSGAIHPLRRTFSSSSLTPVQHTIISTFDDLENDLEENMKSIKNHKTAKYNMLKCFRCSLITLKNFILLILILSAMGAVSEQIYNGFNGTSWIVSAINGANGEKNDANFNISTSTTSTTISSVDIIYFNNKSDSNSNNAAADTAAKAFESLQEEYSLLYNNNNKTIDEKVKNFANTTSNTTTTTATLSTLEVSTSKLPLVEATNLTFADSSTTPVPSNELNSTPISTFADSSTNNNNNETIDEKVENFVNTTSSTTKTTATPSTLEVSTSKLPLVEVTNLTFADSSTTPVPSHELNNSTPIPSSSLNNSAEIMQLIHGKINSTAENERERATTPIIIITDEDKLIEITNSSKEPSAENSTIKSTDDTLTTEIDPTANISVPMMSNFTLIHDNAQHGIVKKNLEITTPQQTANDTFALPPHTSTEGKVLGEHDKGEI